MIRVKAVELTMHRAEAWQLLWAAVKCLFRGQQSIRFEFPGRQYVRMCAGDTEGHETLLAKLDEAEKGRGF